MKRHLFFLAALLVVPTFTDAQNTHLLRINIKKGQVIRQEMKITTQMPGAATGGKATNITMIMVMKQTCTDAQKDKFTIVSEIESARATGGTPEMNKMITQQLQSTIGQKETMTVDSRGNPIGASANQAGGFYGYPKDAVKVGQSWTANVNLGNLGARAGSVKSTMKLLGVERVNNQNCFKMSMNLSSSMQNMTVTGNGTIWARTSDGMLEKGNVKTTTNIKGQGQGAGMNISGSMEMKRL